MNLQKMKLSDQPVAYEKAFKAVAGVLILFGIIQWTDVQIAGVLLAFESLAGIIIWNSVTPNSRVQGRVDDAVAQRDAEVTSYLAVEAKRQEGEFYELVAPLITNATEAIESSRPALGADGI